MEKIDPMLFPTQANDPKSITIVLSGGGTGGHITPILAVAAKLKQIKPNCRLIYIGERHGKFAQMIENTDVIDETYTIFAGKFRRYHGEAWWIRLTDIKTNFLNLRDFFYCAIGTIQSWRLLRKIKPDAVFLKGGFVGVPVGFAAHWRQLKFITHDSDSLPGLANRLVGKWAVWHATGMPEEFYPYPKDKTKYVGVLVSDDYKITTPEIVSSYREQIGLPVNSRVLLVTGGSGGAARINLAIKALVPELLEKYPDLYITHQVGKGKAEIYDDYHHDRLKIFELLSPMHVYTGASDLVVTRAGANTVAELGVQAKAAIVIPNPLLTGGHQLKNADYLREQAAAQIIDESTLGKVENPLLNTITDLLDDTAKRQELGVRLHSITPPDAAEKLAVLLLEAGNSDYVKKKETNI